MASKTRFTGKYEELRDRLTSLNGEGEWHDLNENQKQFRHRAGGIVNWYPSTGTITFQGPGDQQSTLQQVVAMASLPPPLIKLLQRKATLKKYLPRRS